MQERIRRAAESASRNPDEVTPILITKTVSADRVREAYETGAKDFGENRVQELLQKKTMLPADIRWHFVGHLQTNKVRSVVGETVLLHSLDRLELAEEIQRQAEKKNQTVDALIEINTTGEPTKSGFSEDGVEKTVEALGKFPRIRIQGLMTIGPLGGDEAAIRKSFQRLRILKERLNQNFPEKKMRHLSMGMSSDFEIAVEEGATMVRIGTAVFGERK